MNISEGYALPGRTLDTHPAQPDGELDTRRHRLNDAAFRLEAVLDGAQSHIERRYGSSSTAGGLSAVNPSRIGSVGQLDDVIDRIDSLVDRAGSVIMTLGAL